MYYFYNYTSTVGYVSTLKCKLYSLELTMVINTYLKKTKVKYPTCGYKQEWLDETHLADVFTSDVNDSFRSYVQRQTDIKLFNFLMCKLRHQC